MWTRSPGPGTNSDEMSEVGWKEGSASAMAREAFDSDDEAVACEMAGL